MMSSNGISWSRLMKFRAECFKNFGGVLDFPVVPPGIPADLFKPDVRVLDIGAGAHKPLQRVVGDAGGIYFSLDTDLDGNFDFRSFDEIPDGMFFDLITANQVLEHLGLSEALAFVDAAYHRVTVNGSLMATVPNCAHPVRQWDCTHVTAWPANDLYSLLRSAGFTIVSMTRYNKNPLTTNPIKKWIVETVCKEFRIDWCDSIMAVGRREG